MPINRPSQQNVRISTDWRSLWRMKHIAVVRIHTKQTQWTDSKVFVRPMCFLCPFSEGMCVRSEIYRAYSAASAGTQIHACKCAAFDATTKTFNVTSLFASTANFANTHTHAEGSGETQIVVHRRPYVVVHRTRVDRRHNRTAAVPIDGVMDVTQFCLFSLCVTFSWLMCLLLSSHVPRSFNDVRLYLPMYIIHVCDVLVHFYNIIVQYICIMLIRWLFFRCCRCLASVSVEILRNITLPHLFFPSANVYTVQQNITYSCAAYILCRSMHS